MDTAPTMAGNRRLRLLLGLAATAVAAAGPPPAAHHPARPTAHAAPAKPGQAQPAQDAQPSPPQPDPSGMDAAVARDPALRRCADLLAPLSPSQSPPGQSSVEAGGPDECRFRNVRLSAGRLVGYRMDTLLVRGIPFGQPPGPVGPFHARVEARGITLALLGQPAKLAWVSRQQQAPFDVTLDGTYDPTTATFALNEASMDGDVLGHAGLRGQLEDVHLATADHGDLPAVDALPSLQALHVELDSRRFLAAYGIPLVVNMLPDDDPDAAFLAGRAKMVAAVNALLPASGASADTTTALADLVADFPHPQHPATLDAQPTTPVPLADLPAVFDDPARVPALLAALKITATYAGTVR